MRVVLALAAGLGLLGCAQAVELRRTSPVSVGASGLEASAEGVLAVLDYTPDAGPRTDEALVRIKNDSDETFHFHPDRVRLVELDSGAVAGSPSAAFHPPNLGSPVQAAVMGASAGAGLGSGSTGGSALGGAAGALGGFAVAAAVEIPLGVYVLVDRAVEHAKEHLGPGDEATFRVRFTGPKLDDGKRYALVLSDSLEQSPDAIPPLVLVDPSSPHSGYAAPRLRGWYTAVHLGGGTLHDHLGSSGLGGIENRVRA